MSERRIDMFIEELRAKKEAVSRYKLKVEGFRPIICPVKRSIVSPINAGKAENRTICLSRNLLQSNFFVLCCYNKMK